MATTDLIATSFVSSTGWTGAVTTVQSSNDTRLTDGTVDELFEIALTDQDVEDTNTVILEVEARTLGTATRNKTLFLELISGGSTVASYTTPVLTTTDSTNASTAITLTGYNTTQVNAWTLKATVQEGGGMADTVTVEVDYIRVVLDYDPPAQNLTAPYYNPDDDVDAYTPLVLTTTYDATAPFYNPDDDVFPTSTVKGFNQVTVDNLYDPNDDVVYSPVTVTFFNNLTAPYYNPDDDQLFAPTLTTTVDITQTTSYVDPTTVYIPTVLATYDLVSPFYNPSDDVVYEGVDVTAFYNMSQDAIVDNESLNSFPAATVKGLNFVISPFVDPLDDQVFAPEAQPFNTVVPPFYNPLDDIIFGGSITVGPVDLVVGFVPSIAEVFIPTVLATYDLVSPRTESPDTIYASGMLVSPGDVTVVAPEFIEFPDEFFAGTVTLEKQTRVIIT